MDMLNIDTKYKMLSGYEMPALGYGVSLLYRCLYRYYFESFQHFK